MQVVRLSELEWRVLVALKREFRPEELGPHLWRGRAEEAGFRWRSSSRSRRTWMRGRSSDASAPSWSTSRLWPPGEWVTRFNALFHWAVPQGRELMPDAKSGGFYHDPRLLAGGRSGIPEREHHGRGSRHRQGDGAPTRRPSTVTWSKRASRPPTPMFWGGRSEIKPSEISPFALHRMVSPDGAGSDAMWS